MCFGSKSKPAPARAAPPPPTVPNEPIDDAALRNGNEALPKLQDAGASARTTSDATGLTIPIG